MNFPSRVLAAAALLVVVPAISPAQTAYNTGAAANVNGSFQDSQWQVSTNGGSTWIQALQVQGPPSPPWQAATTAYSWVAATTSASGGGGNYLFRTFFDLTGYDPFTAALSFVCAMDNGGGTYSLNGGASTFGCPLWSFGSTQTISSGFVNGSNELRIAVTGDNQTDGLVVGNMSLRANAVVATPEPASLGLFATGLAGLIATVRRRKAA